jgi:hypothetical protein
VQLAGAGAETLVHFPKGVEPNRSAVATLALVNVPVANRLAAFLRNTLLGASNISGNDTFTPDTSTVIGWLEASGEARAWARGQIRRSDLGIEDIAVVDGFRGKHILFSHRGLDVPIVLGLESRGTRKLVHLLPLIRLALDITGLAILDEMDGALHVDMLAEILDWFRGRVGGNRPPRLLRKLSAN